MVSDIRCLTLGLISIKRTYSPLCLDTKSSNVLITSVSCVLSIVKQVNQDLVRKRR